MASESVARAHSLACSADASYEKGDFARASVLYAQAARTFEDVANDQGRELDQHARDALQLLADSHRRKSERLSRRVSREPETSDVMQVERARWGEQRERDWRRERAGGGANQGTRLVGNVQVSGRRRQGWDEDGASAGEHAPAEQLLVAIGSLGEAEQRAVLTPFPAMLLSLLLPSLLPPPPPPPTLPPPPCSPPCSEIKVQ
eukprot:441243-Hanusia_phi.AAC.1